MHRFSALLATGLILVLTAALGAQSVIRIGTPAQDFPPGLFTDANPYKLKDFDDKLLVLYFFEVTCPRCREAVPERNKTIAAYKGKPVKFLAVAPNATLPQLQAYLKETGLTMPVFADSLGLMQARYGFKISLQNIMQTRIVGPDGKIAAGSVFLESNVVDSALDKAGVRARYNPSEYDAKLRPALELLEFGRYGPALKALGPFTRSSSKTISEAAKTLVAEAKADAEKWKAEADNLAFIEPIKAYDLYQKTATLFPNDEPGKGALSAIRKLASDKMVAQELTARKAYTALLQTMSQTTVVGGPAIAQSCKAFLKKHAGTPTAETVDQLYKELISNDLAGKVPVGKGAK